MIQTELPDVGGSVRHPELGPTIRGTGPPMVLDRQTRGVDMPTVLAHHNVKDKDHWLASTKREEVFGPLGITNIRTFVDPQNPSQVGIIMDVADLDALM